MRDLGRRPIDAATQGLHQRRVDAAVVHAVRPRRFGAVSVAAACVVGFMVGSTGLAMADALPDPAQELVHDVLRVVTVDVPARKEAKRGPCVAEAAKLDDQAAKQAAKDACPRGGGASEGGTGDGSPGRSDQAPGHGGQTPHAKGKGTTKHEGDPCHGRPPWAGKMSKQERDAARQAASRDACAPDTDDDLDSTAGTEAQDPNGSGAQPGTNETTSTTTVAEQPATTAAEVTPSTTTTTAPTTVPERSADDTSTTGEPSEG